MKPKEYTGVHYSTLFKKYQAKVTHLGIVYGCGTHDTAKDAARARDIKIIEKCLPHKLQVLKKVKKDGKAVSPSGDSQ